MENLSIQEKAKAYDKVIERANSLLSGNQLGNAWIYKLLPELKESEDEIVIAALKSGIDGLLKKEYHLKGIGGILFDRINTWLEKQGEHANFLNKIQVGDKVTRNKDGMLVNLSRLNRVAKKDEKQGEQKPADKVEPKFEVDNWVVYEDQTLQIVGVFKDGYATNNSAQGFIPKERKHSMRLWTIQDAKDGDVIYEKSTETIILFKSEDCGWVDSHCSYWQKTKTFERGERQYGKVLEMDICPATKEQRDTLFAKITDAGYEWDAEKKELKKIKQEIAWSEEEERMLDEMYEFFDKHKFPSLKHGMDDYAKLIKFFKDRWAWKPSEAQLASLTIACDRNDRIGFDLTQLLNDLKKLKG